MVAPAPCTETVQFAAGGGGDVRCSEYPFVNDDQYHFSAIDTTSIKAFSLASVGDDVKPCMLYKLKDDATDTTYITRALEWTLTLEGVPYRAKVAGASNKANENSDKKYYYETKTDSAVTPLAADAVNGTIYALFSFTGMVKIAPRAFPTAKEGKAFFLDGAGLLTQKTVDAGFDKEDALTSSAAVGDEVVRAGYFVIAVDMAKGNVTYITPIWGQNAPGDGVKTRQGE